MKNRRKKRERTVTLRLWTWNEVTKAIPYLRSVIGSIREHWLDLQSVQRDIDKEAARPGLAKRQQIIDMATHQEDRDRAQAKFDEAIDELNKIDVFLLDPVRGLALIPFRKGDDLAWYVFDHFTPRGVLGWRFQNDPIDQCRPLEEEVAREVVV